MKVKPFAIGTYIYHIRCPHCQSHKIKHIMEMTINGIAANAICLACKTPFKVDYEKKG